MNIVHICLCGATTDGFLYQENLLAKFHKKMGHVVTLITSQWIIGDDGKLTTTCKTDYYNTDGVRVIRIPILIGTIDTRLKVYPTLIHVVREVKPDLLFIHACQFLDICRLACYLKKNPKIRVYVDNHADYSNSAKGWVSKNILHRVIWKYCANKINPYVTTFWGVMPARVDFLIDLYDLPREKCKLLVMGADDDLANWAHKKNCEESLREKYHIDKNDFLIVTGGKIDQWKTQTLLLMQAILQYKAHNIKLIVFGSVIDGLKKRVDDLTDGVRVQFIGWQSSEESYRLFDIADLAVFPGRHSVYWEQATGQGIPMIVKNWEGTHHVDLGGNVFFLYHDSVREISNAISDILENDKKKYREMKQVACTEGPKVFRYSSIAKRSIDV